MTSTLRLRMLLELYDLLPSKDDVFEYSLFISATSGIPDQNKKGVFQGLMSNGFIKFHSIGPGYKMPKVFYQLDQNICDLIEYMKND